MATKTVDPEPQDMHKIRLNSAQKKTRELWTRPISCLKPQKKEELTDLVDAGSFVP